MKQRKCERANSTRTSDDAFCEGAWYNLLSTERMLKDDSQNDCILSFVLDRLRSLNHGSFWTMDYLDYELRFVLDYVAHAQ